VASKVLLALVGLGLGDARAHAMADEHAADQRLGQRRRRMSEIVGPQDTTSGE